MRKATEEKNLKDSCAPRRHPLAALRAALDLTGIRHLRQITEHHPALGYGPTAERREDRWESRAHTPESAAQFAITDDAGSMPTMPVAVM